MAGVKPYKISTIVDPEARTQGDVPGVKPYKISTIVDVRRDGDFGTKSVKLYKISTSVDKYNNQKFKAIMYEHTKFLLL